MPPQLQAIWNTALLDFYQKSNYFSDLEMCLAMSYTISLLHFIGLENFARRRLATCSAHCQWPMNWSLPC